MWRATRIAGVVLVACIAVTACSGDDDATSSTTSTSSSVPSPTESSTTPETTPPTSSTSPSSTTSSAPPSSSSTHPLTDEQAVLAAYEAAYDSYNAASAAPNDPELRRALDEFWADPILETLVERLDGYVIDEKFVRVNPDVEAGFWVRSVSVEGDEAALIVCTIDPWNVVQRTADGETVVDSEVYVWLEQYSVRHVDGTWYVSDGTLIEDLSESGTCDEE